MCYGEGSFEDCGTADNIVSEEAIGYIFLGLGGDHLRIAYEFFPFLLPFGHPLGSALREDATKVYQKRGVAVAVVEVGEQPQLFFGCETVLLPGAGLHHFLEHFADFLVGEGEATDEEFGGEEEQRLEPLLGVVGGLERGCELLGDVLEDHRREVLVLVVEAGGHLGVEADLALADAGGDERGYLLEVLAEVEGAHLGEDGLVVLALGLELGDELLDGLDLRRLGLALEGLGAAVEVDRSQRHPPLVAAQVGLVREGRRLFLGLLLHYYYHYRAASK